MFSSVNYCFTVFKGFYCSNCLAELVVEITVSAEESPRRAVVLIVLGTLSSIMS